jgi:hypothetical protein
LDRPPEPSTSSLRELLSVNQGKGASGRKAQYGRYRRNAANRRERGAGRSDAALAAELDGHRAGSGIGRCVGGASCEKRVETVRVDSQVENRHVRKCTERCSSDDRARFARGIEKCGAQLSRLGGIRVVFAASRKLRAVLFDAAGETRSIVAAAAFRALADMSEFDSRIDARRLNSLLSRCAADSSSAPAARAMAVQLCGERRVVSARSALEAICADESAPEVLRRSAWYSMSCVEGKDVSQ